MNQIRGLVLATLFFNFSFQLANAQDATNDLIKQGIELHKQGKFDEAIGKFNEVLKSDSENAFANYEIAYSLYASKKFKEAIPRLLTAVKSSKASINVPAYSLLATIYDEGGRRQQAVDAYNEAIRINPDYPQIYYNLGIVYFGNKQYAEAELAAISAIKHDPKNASSHRLYALVTFHQNKRANALLGLCSFLLLEPTGPRAVEAYGNVQHILQGGLLTDAHGNTVIGVSLKDEPETGTLNNAITLSVKSAKAKGLTGSALLEAQLKGIFSLVGQLSEKKTEKSFFDNFFAGYFYKLAQSTDMPSITHTVALDIKWKKENAQQVTAFLNWVSTTDRPF